MDMSEATPVALSPGLPARLPGLGAVHDWIVRRAAVGWFLFVGATLAWGLVNAAAQLDLSEPRTLALADIAELLSRFAMLLFFFTAAWLALVRAKPVARAKGVLPRITALLGVVLLFGIVLLPRLEHAPAALLFLSAALAALGNALSVVVLNRLGKSFSIMSEARGLVTDGPYRLVRHPLYLAEEIAIIGVFLAYWSLPGLLLFATHLAVQLLRMRNEERVLQAAFPGYADYASRTPRFIPGIW